MEARVNRIRILHIDDDEDDRLMVKECIKEYDATVDVMEVQDGHEGLLFLMNAKQEGNLPSLIILDLNMPKMDGKVCLTEIKKDNELSRIPLVIFTTSANEIDRSFALKEEVEFITKPTTASKLTETIQKLMNYC
jgi:CheY-like chemotaxis protein